MREIIVDYNKLLDTASKIEENENDYEKYCSNLNEEVEKMATSWNGKDNLAFVNQIKSYSDDFRQISIIMKQYIEFLRNSSKAYSETQEELYAQAQKLRG